MDSSTSEVKGIGGAAIALIIFGLVAVIFMALFFVIRNYMNTAQEGVTSTMDDLLSQTYSQYDDVTQTGADVLAFLKTNRATDMVVFVGTYNSMGGYFEPEHSLKTGAAAATAQTGFNGYFYCGLPGTTANVGKGTSGKDLLEFKDLGGKVGTVFCVTDLSQSATSAYDIEHNTNFSPTTMQSDANHYIKSNARFYSRAIYNASTNEMVGVAFFQLN